MSCLLTYKLASLEHNYLGHQSAEVKEIVVCYVRSKATRFRWIQTSDDGAAFNVQHSWALTHVYIGDECDCSCAGHGRCSHATCVSVLYTFVFYARQLYRQVLLRVRISYGNSVRSSVCPGVTTRTESSPGQIETPGFHHMIA